MKTEGKQRATLEEKELAYRRQADRTSEREKSSKEKACFSVQMKKGNQRLVAKVKSVIAARMEAADS